MSLRFVCREITAAASDGGRSNLNLILVYSRIKKVHSLFVQQRVRRNGDLNDFLSSVTSSGETLVFGEGGRRSFHPEHFENR